MIFSNWAVRFWVLCALLSFLASAKARAAERAIFLSPSGNDAWSGMLPAPNAEKSDGPVASPQRARELVCAFKARQEGSVGPVHVYLRGGTYFLSEPLVLTPADSGTKEAPVIWCAYQKEHPVFSGGQRLTGWTRTRLNGQDVWLTKLPGGSFRELWIDGKRAVRSRWPKQGTLAVAGLSANAKQKDWRNGVTQFRYSGEDIRAWPTALHGEVVVTNRWVESHLPITSIDDKNHLIRFGKRSVFSLDPGDRYWVENVRECLTEAGEFYVDDCEKTVYLIPPLGADPNTSQVIAPRLAQVVRLMGDPAADKFVQHIIFRGVGFMHNEWYFDQPLMGQPAAAAVAFRPDPSRSGFHQAAVGVPGAVWGRGVRACIFEGCEIAHTGTYGIELSQGCQGNRISHSEFAHRSC